MYIKHLADSVNFKAVTPNKNCNGLTGLLSEMPNASYTNRLSRIPTGINITKQRTRDHFLIGV